MMIKDWKKDLFTIPNWLSLFRLVLIPVYITLYLHAQTTRDYIIAAIVLAVSCFTDFLDGKIARKFNMISRIGKILDPVADKMTQFSLLITLTRNYMPLRYLSGLFVIKEGFQLIASILLLRKKKILKGAHMAGKVCTTVLFISLIILLLFRNLPYYVVVGITLTDSVFMLISFYEYIRIFSGHGDHIEEL